MIPFILLNVNRKRSRTIFRVIFTDQVPEREAQAPVGPASAAVACVVFGSFGVVRLLAPPAAHPSSLIKCVSVVYADEARADWSRRTVMVRMNNGTESSIKVVASRPRATKGKPL
ncbi:MAG: hypothetical protein ACKOWG_20590 [Planctomycetia bacterium]